MRRISNNSSRHQKSTDKNKSENNEIDKVSENSMGKFRTRIFNFYRPKRIFLNLINTVFLHIRYSSPSHDIYHLRFLSLDKRI